MKIYRDGEVVTQNDARRAIGPALLSDLMKWGQLLIYDTIWEYK